MGGNGKYIPGHPGLVLLPPVKGVNPTIYLEPGLGGGCVTTGPFGNMTVNLGPIGLVNASVGPDGGFGYNPRCLKRDVGPYCSLKYCNYTRIYGTRRRLSHKSFLVGSSLMFKRPRPNNLEENRL
jgi:tyrosinase